MQLDYRSSEVLESTKVEVNSAVTGKLGNIFFIREKEYNHYTNGKIELFKEYFIKRDERDFAHQQYLTYSTEKAFRNAIKRWQNKK